MSDFSTTSPDDLVDQLSQELLEKTDTLGVMTISNDLKRIGFSHIFTEDPLIWRQVLDAQIKMVTYLQARLARQRNCPYYPLTDREKIELGLPDSRHDQGYPH